MSHERASTDALRTAREEILWHLVAKATYLLEDWQKHAMTGDAHDQWNAGPEADKAWERFAALVAEECAKVCEATWVEPGDLQVDNCHAAAKLIRAKFPLPE